MNEIHGKSILVRVSARFELARVRVIGSRLYTVYAKAIPKNVEISLRLYILSLMRFRLKQVVDGYLKKQ